MARQNFLSNFDFEQTRMSRSRSVRRSSKFGRDRASGEKIIYPSGRVKARSEDYPQRQTVFSFEFSA
jgi:hypothetical protein